MKAIYLKELKSLLGSMGLMLAVAVFFVMMGLWLWFFPETSILTNKFSTLQTLFDLAPWLFLFIIPALTMRSIAEEKSAGTLALLKSKPLSMWELVTGKFLAIVVLILIILLVCQLYTFSVYQLGLPKGNLDLGGTIGSFLGWFLLAGAYISIGIFASAISNNQMIAFLSAVFLCFTIYTGPSLLSTIPFFQGNGDDLLQLLGMQAHYTSLARGVIQSRDLFYFLFVVGLFLLLASIILKYDPWNGKSILNELRSNLFVWMTLAFFCLSFFKLFSLDLTGDKRYTMGEETKDLVRSVDDVIYVDVLMDGKFPAAFKRLRNAAIDQLTDFNRLNKNIKFAIEDPLQGKPETIQQNQESLRQIGINPTKLTVYNGKEQEQKIIYPWAIFHFGERSIPVSLLESQDPNSSEDEVLNKSVSLLEYKFGNAIQKLRMKKNPVVAFTTGHDELKPIQTGDIERALRPVFQTGRIVLDSVIKISNEVNVLIVAKPQTPFSTRDNFLIDQYIMNGGKVIWFIDPLFVNTDTVNRMNREKKDFIPLPYNLNLDELWFKYGFRIQPNIILDYSCSTIPLLSGYSGSTPQFQPHPWYYHPLIVSDSKHPVVNDLDRISMFYPATIDTLRTKTSIEKVILLHSSDHSRTVTSPSPINFEMVREELKPDQFNRTAQPVGILLSGVFPSAFENRLGPDFAAMLKLNGNEFKSTSAPTSMIVYSDGDLICNAISNRGEPAPLGFNLYEQRTYPANKNLMLNSIEYLIDEHQMMNARNKVIKLRLLDQAHVKSEGSMWSYFNLVIPSVFFVIFSFVYNVRRKRKYASR